MKDMITKRFNLNNINLALDEMKNGSIGKCVIEMNN